MTQRELDDPDEYDPDEPVGEAHPRADESFEWNLRERGYDLQSRAPARAIIDERKYDDAPNRITIHTSRVQLRFLTREEEGRDPDDYRTGDVVPAGERTFTWPWIGEWTDEMMAELGHEISWLAYDGPR